MRDSAQRDPRWNVLERTAFRATNGDPTYEKLRNRLLKNVARTLYSAGISPNIVSATGLVAAILASFLLESYLIAAFFILLNMVADGLDGVIARVNNIDSNTGAKVDLFCDTASSVSIIVGVTVTYALSVQLALVAIAIVVFYTLTSARRSSLIIGRFRSLGSRIAIGIGSILILLASQFQWVSAASPSTLFSGFFVTLTISLSIILISDYLLKVIIVNVQDRVASREVEASK